MRTKSKPAVNKRMPEKYKRRLLFISIMLSESGSQESHLFRRLRIPDQEEDVVAIRRSGLNQNPGPWIDVV